MVEERKFNYSGKLISGTGLPLCRVTDEKFSEQYNLLCRVDSKDSSLAEDAPTAGFVEEVDHSLRCYFPFNQNGRLTCLFPEEKPNLSKVEIKIYPDKELVDRILKGLDNTALGEVLYYDLKEEGNLNAQVLEDKIKAFRDGSRDDQVIFMKLRDYLVDEGFMPVDEKGQPYDLSQYFIPTFNTKDFLADLKKDNSNLIGKFEKKSEKEITIALNQMKTKSPQGFIAVYSYLISKNYIPPSPVLTELNFSEEQLNYLLRYDEATWEPLSENIPDGLPGRKISMPIQKMVNGLLLYLRENIKDFRTATIEQVNETLSQMRFGNFDQQETYYNLCSLAREMYEPKPSSLEERTKLIEMGRRMIEARKRKTEMIKVQV